MDDVIDYNRFKIHMLTERITFESVNRRRTYAMDLTSLRDHYGVMSDQQWASLQKALIDQMGVSAYRRLLLPGPSAGPSPSPWTPADPPKVMPRSTPRHPSWSTSREHPTFGTLIDVDSRAGVVKFRRADGVETKLTKDLLFTIMQTMLTTGAIVKQDVATVIGATFDPITPPPPTPEEAFQSIVKDARRDPEAKVGYWLTKITNDLTALLREDDE